MAVQVLLKTTSLAYRDLYQLTAGVMSYEYLENLPGAARETYQTWL